MTFALNRHNIAYRVYTRVYTAIKGSPMNRDYDMPTIVKSFNLLYWYIRQTNGHPTACNSLFVCLAMCGTLGGLYLLFFHTVPPAVIQNHPFQSVLSTRWISGACVEPFGTLERICLGYRKPSIRSVFACAHQQTTHVLVHLPVNEPINNCFFRNRTFEWCILVRTNCVIAYVVCLMLPSFRYATARPTLRDVILVYWRGTITVMCGSPERHRSRVFKNLLRMTDRCPLQIASRGANRKMMIWAQRHSIKRYVRCLLVIAGSCCRNIDRSEVLIIASDWRRKTSTLRR